MMTTLLKTTLPLPPFWDDLTLEQNHKRVEDFDNRDWWGNRLTSSDESEHIWNLYQEEKLPNYKHSYLKMWCNLKGVIPEHDRDTLGFPIFTEEQIKELEALHG